MKLDNDANLPLRDVVFQTLRRSILMGELRPGERLMEVRLTHVLGVSRTPIREAIRMLELEGLVDMVPRKGATVSYITEKDLQDVLEVRSALEELAVSLACDRITPMELEKLEQAMIECREAIERNDLTEAAERDVAFHDIIFESTGNLRLIQILFNLREQMFRYRLEYLKNKSMHERLIREHSEIFHALKTGDKETAKASISAHLANQALTVAEDIRSNSPAGGKNEE